MSRFLGLYPRLVLSAPLVLGKGGDRDWTQMDASGAGRMVQGNGLSADDADYRRWGKAGLEGR